MSFWKWPWSFPIQARQETDKSAAVATVVAAVDMARVREPVIGAVEQTAQRTTTTAVHIQPAQEQVGTQLARASWACRDPVANQRSRHVERSAEPSVAQTSRTLWAKDGLRYQGCWRYKYLKFLVHVRQVDRQEWTTKIWYRRSEKEFKYQHGPGSRQAKCGQESQLNEERACASITVVPDQSVQSSVAPRAGGCGMGGEDHYCRADVTFLQASPKDLCFYFPQNKCDIWFTAEKCYKSRIISHLIFE